MKRLPILILIFSIAFAIFILIPGLLNKPFSPYPNLKIADILDLFTPLVIILLYFLLLQFGSNQIPNFKSMIILIIFAVVWVEGQAMHLAANSIGHWLSDSMSDEIYQVTYFYDEVLSHYIWHFGVAALSVQLMYRSWRYPFKYSSRLILETIAAVIYGITIFIMSVEGGTVPLLFPFSVLAVIICSIWGWSKFKHIPVLTFFLLGYAIAAILLSGWGLYWSGFPQFSELCWI